MKIISNGWKLIFFQNIFLIKKKLIIPDQAFHRGLIRALRQGYKTINYATSRFRVTRLLRRKHWNLNTLYTLHNGVRKYLCLFMYDRKFGDNRKSYGVETIGWRVYLFISPWSNLAKFTFDISSKCVGCRKISEYGRLDELSKYLFNENIKLREAVYKTIFCVNNNILFYLESTSENYFRINSR